LPYLTKNGEHGNGRQEQRPASVMRVGTWLRDISVPSSCRADVQGMNPAVFFVASPAVLLLERDGRIEVRETHYQNAK